MTQTPTKLEITQAYAGGAIYTDAALDQVDLEHATELWRHHRIRAGFAATAPRLMPEPASNAKLAKSSTYTLGLSLAPHRLAGIGNVCTHSTPECRLVCLESSGQGWRSTVQAGRAVRTTFLAMYPLECRAMLRDELRRALKRHGRKACAWRPNVLSDIPWHAEPWVQALPKRLRVYGYSKRVVTQEEAGRVDITFSISERQPTLADALEILNTGRRIAVVTAADLPKSIAGYPVLDGERTDERWREPVGIVRLVPKGKALKLAPAMNGFVKPAEWFELAA